MIQFYWFFWNNLFIVLLDTQVLLSVFKNVIFIVEIISDASFFSMDLYCLCPRVIQKLLLESRVFCFSTVCSGLGRDNLGKNINILKYETDRCAQSRMVNAYLEEPELKHLGFGCWAPISSCPWWGLQRHRHRPSILTPTFFFIIVTDWPAAICPSWCTDCF